MLEQDVNVSFRVRDSAHALQVFQREGVKAKEGERGIIHTYLEEEAIGNDQNVGKSGCSDLFCSITEKYAGRDVLTIDGKAVDVEGGEAV